MGLLAFMGAAALRTILLKCDVSVYLAGKNSKSRARRLASKPKAIARARRGAEARAVSRTLKRCFSFGLRPRRWGPGKES